MPNSAIKKHILTKMLSFLTRKSTKHLSQILPVNPVAAWKKEQNCSREIPNSFTQLSDSYMNDLGLNLPIPQFSYLQNGP